jgi:endonuclease YncB( thermonuclease family)
MLRIDAVSGKRQCQFGLALFLCLLGAACSRSEPTSPVPTAERVCQADAGELEKRRVARVVDGDTLHLVGGDKIRLIGVNTPELGRDGRPDEPLAGAARTALVAMLGSGREVWLQDGEQVRDRHGRRLAYAFNGEGSSLAAQLIARGLGFHVAIAPNDRYASCLQSVDAAASRNRVGVWREPSFAALSVAELGRDQGGFLRVRDRVTRVSFKRNGWWLQLGGKLGVQIDGDARSLFSKAQLRELEGRKVEVRGWLVPMQGDWWMMNLGHPHMLQQR